MADTKNTSSGGIGFMGMLAILFIGLKLTGYIDWSWLWVLSPLWIGFAIFGGIPLIVAVAAGVLALVEARGMRRRR